VGNLILLYKITPFFILPKAVKAINGDQIMEYHEIKEFFPKFGIELGCLALKVDSPPQDHHLGQDDFMFKICLTVHGTN
jgi:hypothetical protein